MTNAEKMLTLVRQQFARDCEMDSYTERHNKHMREMYERRQATGTWGDAATEAGQLWTAYWAEWDRHQRTGDECFAELNRLRAEAPPDELTAEQRDEIRELLSAMRSMADRRAKEAQTAAEQAQRSAGGGPLPDYYTN